MTSTFEVDYQGTTVVEVQEEKFFVLLKNNQNSKRLEHVSLMDLRVQCRTLGTATSDTTRRVTKPPVHLRSDHIGMLPIGTHLSYRQAIR